MARRQTQFQRLFPAVRARDNAHGGEQRLLVTRGIIACNRMRRVLTLPREHSPRWHIGGTSASSMRARGHTYLKVAGASHRDRGCASARCGLGAPVFFPCRDGFGDLPGVCCIMVSPLGRVARRLAAVEHSAPAFSPIRSNSAVPDATGLTTCRCTAVKLPSSPLSKPGSGLPPPGLPLCGKSLKIKRMDAPSLWQCPDDRQ